MRRIVARLLWWAFVMVQDTPMPIMVWMDDDHSYTVDVEGDPEDALERVKNREGEFASGWLTERGGLHLNVAHIVKMRVSRSRPV